MVCCNLFFCFVLIFSIGLVLAWYLGLFQRVLFKTGLKGEYKFVYDKFIGPYDKTHTVMKKVHKAIEKEYGKFGNDHRCFGCYFDNPKKVKGPKLRSIGGCLITDDDLFEKISENVNFKTLVVPKTLSIFTYFRLPGLCKFVYVIALIMSIPRIYKKFERLYGKKYTPDEDYGGCFEIYDWNGFEIVIPIKLEKDFFDDVKSEFKD